MSAPPEKKMKESTTISMVVDKWRKGQVEQISPVHRIGGYPWRLRLFKYANRLRYLSLICDKSTESELWECKATVENKWSAKPDVFTYSSWRATDKTIRMIPRQFADGAVLEVDVNVENIVEASWRLCPTLDPLAPRDGILVVDERKIHVNKESLASQSPFFEQLFKGHFKEENMAEIPIADVGYEEFSNLIRMVYDFEGASLTDENVRRVLELADRFALKIVEDCVVNYLLSSASLFSIHEKLLISEQYNLPFLKDHLLPRYDEDTLLGLCDAPEWEILSKQTIRDIIKNIHNQQAKHE